MIDDNTKDGSNPGNKASDKADELIEKGKYLADKAEDFFSEKVNELLKKAKEAGRKIRDQVDDTIDSFKGEKGPVDNQNGGGI